MLCSNCGKNIPYAGKVCPYCKIDKSADQIQHTGCMIIFVIVAVLFFIIKC